MTLAMTLKHLAAARRYVSDGERELFSQRKLVAKLEQKGHDPLEAILILEEMEEMQNMYVGHRDRLEQQVSELIRP